MKKKILKEISILEWDKKMRCTREIRCIRKKFILGLREKVKKIKKPSSFYSEKHVLYKVSYVLAEGRNFSVLYKFRQYRIKYPIPDKEGLKIF